MTHWWRTLPPRSRFGLVGGLAVLTGFLLAAAWWLLRVDHAVLFSELRPQDAATMTTELEKLKIPYVLADNGTTVLVERAHVPAVRLKLMGRDLPLHGTVGLEIFNHTDFGMTEFAQKINYQRALQGELTRTILSFPEVRDARVHLALPEQGLFRQAAGRPKAAVTLALRQGHALRPQQVSGIQRLVAAAVPGLHPQEVTLVDQQGAALSRAADEGEPAAARLDLKRDLESYLARKVGRVLDQAFGPGAALASVDVTLDMDQVRVTTEDVLAAPEGKGATATGVLVRERESARDAPVAEGGHVAVSAARGSSMQRDAEYQAGRRVEQVVSQPGAIRRLQVVAVVQQDLGVPERAQVERLVAAAAGAVPERGDTVVVQSLATRARNAGEGIETPVAMSAPPAAAAGASVARTLGVAAAGVVLALAALAAVWQRRRSSSPRQPRLTQAQRLAALQRVQGWLLEAQVAEGTKPTGRNP